MLKLILKDYAWIHLGLGWIGNMTFFVGSVFFLPAFKEFKELGIWLFIIGAFLMLLGSTGRFLVDLIARAENK